MYLKTNFSTPTKLAEFGRVLENPRLDPDAYKAFVSFFQGNPQAKAAVEDAARGGKAVAEWIKDLNMQTSRTGTAGAVTAGVTAGGMAAGSAGAAASAGMIALVTGILPRAIARAATEGNPSVLNAGRYVSRWLGGLAASTGGTGLGQLANPPEQVKKAIALLQSYAGEEQAE
jgi:hypothetical protein